MRDNKYLFERYFYWLAFLVALFLRFFQLGAGPLSETEAGWALQALGLAHGSTASLGAQPAYILLTSQLFSLFGDTNFLARCLPALAGSLLVWLPFYLRRWMGDINWMHRAGLVLAFGLALDPGLVSLSRQAGSQMPAVAFTLLMLVAIINRRMVWVGIFAGLALLSGPAFLQGLLIWAISWGIFRLVGRKPAQSQPEEGQAEPPDAWSAAVIARQGLPAFALTLLVAGTLLLRAPQGLAALAETLPAYLQTWITSSGVPILRLPASLLIYQPLVVIFALVALIRSLVGKQDDPPHRRLVFGLLTWAVVAMILSMLYAGRLVGDMAWALIPLWVLTSLEIGHAMPGGEDKTTRVVAGCLAAFLFLLAVVGWFRLLEIGRYNANVALYWAIIIGAFLLGLIAVLLVTAGWSINAAKIGMVGSLCAVLGLQLIANGIGMNIVRQNNAQELWPQPPSTGQADLLLTTLSNFSSWNTGLRDQLDVVVLDGTPSLKWALRHFPNARFENALAPTESPSVVITYKGTEEPILAEKYRGQDFVWQQYPGWQSALPSDFINWLAFRNAQLSDSQVILWARVDIFPGGAPATAGSTSP